MSNLNEISSGGVLSGIIMLVITGNSKECIGLPAISFNNSGVMFKKKNLGINSTGNCLKLLRSSSEKVTFTKGALSWETVADCNWYSGEVV